MALTITGVTLTIAPLTRPCPPAGGTFTVTVTVTGAATGAGGTYDVELFDLDPVTPDLLDSAVNNAVAAGPLAATHTFTLTCDSLCEVRGRLGSSGEQKAEIRATVTVGATKTQSPTRTAQCGAGTYRGREETVEQR